MRPLTVAVVVFGVATYVAAGGSSLGAADVQHGAEAAAMLALAACTALAGRAAPRPLHRALLALCLLLAASALVNLAADRMPLPAPAPWGPNNCPIETAITDYRRGRLRYGQLAEVLRFIALACALQAVRMLPRSPRPRPWPRRLITALLLTPLVLIGLFPFASASDAVALLTATVPGLLAMATATALTVLTLTRTGGRSAENVLLIAGVILMLLPALSAVQTLADLYRQIPDPDPDVVHRACVYSLVTASSPSAPTAGSAIAVAALFLTAPALFTWSALQRDPPARPPNRESTPDRGPGVL